jgi:hypothetical protein
LHELLSILVFVESQDFYYEFESTNILLWLLDSFISHLVFPHDHHLTDSFIIEEDLCPVSKGTQDINLDFRFIAML